MKSQSELLYAELTREIVGSFYDVYREVGSGRLEVLYQRAMAIALEDKGLACQREVPTSVHFRGHLIGAFRMDLIVENRVIVECRTAERIVAAHRVQSLNYLRASNLPIALILNFGTSPTFGRLINGPARAR